MPSGCMGIIVFRICFFLLFRSLCIDIKLHYVKAFYSFRQPSFKGKCLSRACLPNLDNPLTINSLENGNGEK